MSSWTLGENKMKAVSWKSEPTTYRIFCLGCNSYHFVPTQKPNRVSKDGAWEFNGDLENPTFIPSLLIRWGNKVPTYEHLDENEYGGGICHSFITNGKMIFLGDCTHYLAGQTVELPQLNINNYKVNQIMENQENNTNQNESGAGNVNESSLSTTTIGEGGGVNEANTTNVEQKDGYIKVEEESLDVDATTEKTDENSEIPEPQPKFTITHENGSVDNHY